MSQGSEVSVPAADVTRHLLTALEAFNEVVTIQHTLDGVRDLCAIILLTEGIDPHSFSNELLHRVEEMRVKLHETVAEKHLEPADG